MSRGYFENGGAWIDAKIRIPSHGSTADVVSFLVDTGSTLNVLQPLDADRLGIDLRRVFTDPRIGVVKGFGGDIRVFDTVAEVTFLDQMDHPQLLPISVAEQTSLAVDLPSVLGMSALRYFRLTLSVGEDLVELERLA